MHVETSPGARRARRFRIPNTHLAAAGVAGALALVGFGIGVLLLVGVPMVRSGQARVVADTRLRLSSQPQLPTTVASLRPELWRTPVARQAFPSTASHATLSDAPTSVRVLYDPDRTRRIVPAPPIIDALGRSRLAVVLSWDADDDPLTPGPIRPDESDPTRLSIVINGPADGGLTGCSLAVRPDGLQVSGLGQQPDEACQEGVVRLSSGVLRFAVLFDQLPNYRARDGSWRAGGAFGRSDVRLQLSGLPE